MRKLNFGIIGCGRISFKHVDGLIDNKDSANLVATCDVVIEKAKEKRDEYLNKLNEKTFINVYSDYNYVQITRIAIFISRF